MSDIEILIANLENAPRIIIPLTRGVKLDLLKRRPRPGKWSAHEHACHLAQVHPLFFQSSGFNVERRKSDYQAVFSR
jgi:hypothetical protein